MHPSEGLLSFPPGYGAAPRPKAAHEIEGAKKKHEIPGIPQHKAGLMGQPDQILPAIAPEMAGQFIVDTPKKGESRNGDKEKSLGGENSRRLSERLDIVGEMFDHIQEESSVPAPFQTKIHQIDPDFLNFEG